MQQCSFTEFHNELARVLGTHQHAISKASTKPVTTKSVEVKEEEEEDAPTLPPSLKSQAKKIRAQSSQIKDLRSKLDQAVAENSQIREFLSPATLTTAFSNMHSRLQRPVLPVSYDMEVTSSLAEASHFWGSTVPLKLAAGKDGVTNPKQSCRYCKDMGHLIEIPVVRLEARQSVPS